MTAKNLRAALAAAQAEVAGTIYKAGANQAQRYNYVGHEHVIEHVRAVMVKHGIIIVPARLTFVGELPKWQTRNGEQTGWLWEQAFEILHTDSDEVRTAVVQATTNTNDKAAFVASTAADRTLLMRLMRLAGTNEENPEHDSHEPERERPLDRGQSAPSTQTQSRGRGEAADPVAVLAQLRTDLARCSDFGVLVDFVVYAYGQLRGLNEQQKTSFWDAFGERCKALKFDPKDVVAAARAKAGRAA